jgi:ubiquinol-cytochrome c reductase cytochrome c1 subunit
MHMLNFRSAVFTAIVAVPVFAAPAMAAEGADIPHVDFSFQGPFGTYDRASLQRGFQVYKEVCAACHGLKHVAFRTLGEKGGPGFSEAEVKAIAAAYQVQAEPNDLGQTVDASGQPLTRPATPADYFPSPFANEKAARVANNGSLPPDLSVIVKAREGHESYIYAFLTHFGATPPVDVQMSPGMTYNPSFPGGQTAMPMVVVDNGVTYADGTQASVAQQSRDVVTFLTWAAEPKMEQRKQMGFGVMIFLIALSTLLFFSYRRVWHGHHDVGTLGDGK